MRLKDDNGVMLVLEAEPYLDCLNMSAYGLSIVLVGVDKQFLETRLEEQDALQLVIDVEIFSPIERTVHGVSCLEYKIAGTTYFEMQLRDEDEIIKCAFSGARRNALYSWLEAFKTFCINRLNETDCILPNQTFKTTKFSMSQN